MPVSALEGKAQAAPPSRDARASPPRAGGTLTAGAGAQEGPRDPAHWLLLWVRGQSTRRGIVQKPITASRGRQTLHPSPAVPHPTPKYN